MRLPFLFAYTDGIELEQIKKGVAQLELQKAQIEKTLLSSKIEHDRVQRELARQQDQSRDHTQFKETLDRQEMELRTLQHNLQRQKLDAHERSLYAETLMSTAQALEQKVPA